MRNIMRIGVNQSQFNCRNQFARGNNDNIIVVTTISLSLTNYYNYLVSLILLIIRIFLITHLLFLSMIVSVSKPAHINAFKTTRKAHTACMILHKNRKETQEELQGLVLHSFIHLMNNVLSSWTHPWPTGEGTWGKLLRRHLQTSA